MSKHLKTTLFIMGAGLVLTKVALVMLYMKHKQLEKDIADLKAKA